MRKLLDNLHPLSMLNHEIYMPKKFRVYDIHIVDS